MLQCAISDAMKTAGQCADLADVENMKYRYCSVTCVYSRDSRQRGKGARPMTGNSTTRVLGKFNPVTLITLRSSNGKPKPII